MILSKTLLFLTLATTLTFSQSISISKAYTENGQPIGAVHNKRVDKGKTYSIILNNDQKEFTQHLVILYITKQGSTNKFDTFSKIILTNENKNWVAFNYTFENDGTYDVYFTNFEREKIASTTVTVNSNSSPRNFERFSSVETRPSMKITFYERFYGGYPVNERDFVSIKKDNGEIYIYVQDIRPFGFDRLLLNIWSKEDYSTVYDQFVDTKKYNIDSSWSDTFFKYTFKKPGQYRINLFNDKEILLKSAYITVTN